MRLCVAASYWTAIDGDVLRMGAAFAAVAVVVASSHILLPLPMPPTSLEVRLQQNMKNQFGPSGQIKLP